jgi:hypothetical protein
MPKRPDVDYMTRATGNDECTKQQENPVERYIFPLGDEIGQRYWIRELSVSRN